MSSEDSVSVWLQLLKEGDRAAALPLWERYFPQLVGRARLALRSVPRRMADEEDVALSAFDSFCRRAEQKRFPQLNNRDDLWRILLTITACKAAHLIRDEMLVKRGGGKVNPEVDLGSDAADEEGVLANIMGAEPSPELAAELAEQYRRLLDKLGDDDLRNIAVWQMEGFTVAEIAAKLGRSERTIARKLAVIRDLWREEKLAS